MHDKESIEALLYTHTISVGGNVLQVMQILLFEVKSKVMQYF